MLLSDRDILARQAEGHISLDPWTPEMVQPASIDVPFGPFLPSVHTIMRTRMSIRLRIRAS